MDRIRYLKMLSVESAAEMFMATQGESLRGFDLLHRKAGLAAGAVETYVRKQRIGPGERPLLAQFLGEALDIPGLTATPKD